MKPSSLPITCCFALTAMTTAGLSHWWSVRQFIAATQSGMPVAATPRTPPQSAPASPDVLPVKTPEPIAHHPTPQPPAPDAGQKAFYEALIEKMNGLQTQNRDLLDQLAETNRDLMKLEFRVDTHSESFRPMPVREDRPFSSADDTSDVLPPRAEPVDPTRE